ncbi:hypothetical protein MP228_011307 [Amoeboaphelidium protococcarum]|nr:hypothetical protein MP228_011307 [Amoeboaphelidium protococcarum]
MQDILAPAKDLHFDFEPYLKNELGLYIGENKRPYQEICKFYLKGNCRHGNHCQYRHIKPEKMVMCKHWLRNLCKKGDQCEFLHEYNLKRMPECWFYANYGECTNADCIYLHIDAAKKTKECPWYNRGFCKHGPQCRNKHTRQMVCQNFMTGFCPLGPECELGHPKFEVHDFVNNNKDGGAHGFSRNDKYQPNHHYQQQRQN